LDNKPFSYATETLLRRRADFPVDRKLIFIEPDPGHPERQRKAKEGEAELPGREPRPDALQNFFKQGVNLPRQEVIRDDLQRIADRNLIIRRIDEILRRVDLAMYVSGSLEGGKPGDASDADLAPLARAPEDVDKDITEDITERGLGYTG